MASISTTEAANLSIGAIPDQYRLDNRPTDQFFELLPFLPIEGHEVKVNYVDASQLRQYADAEAAGQAVTTTMPPVLTRTFPLRRVSAELPVDSIIPGVYGSHRDIVQALINLKVDAVRDHCKHLLVHGDSGTNPEEFDGLLQHCEQNSRSVGAAGNAANGGTVAKGEIEAIVSALNPRVSSENTYLVMHSDAYKHLVKNNYTDVEYVEHDLLGTLPSIIGVPILIDNHISTTETQGSSTDCTSIYAVMIGEDNGVCGIYPGTHQGQEIQVRGPIVKEATDTMWFHVSWDVGFAVFNSGGIYRLKGVKHTN